MTNNTIKLGLMAPLTGLVEMYGQEISWAAQIACQEINDQGGLLGKPLELVTIDDGSLPDTAVPAANALIDKHDCVAIIGNLLSNSRIAVANQVAEPRHVPYLNFSFYEGSIGGRYFFHFAALPNQQIDKMIPYMAAHFGHKMFFAGSNYEWPRGSIDAAKKALLSCGGEIVGEQYLPIGSTQIDELLEQVAKSGADVFVPYFAGSDQINLLTRFTELGLKEKMKVVMGHYDEAMVQNIPAHIRQGFYSSNTYFMSLDTAENNAYLNNLQQLPEVDGIWPEGNGVLTNFGEGTYLCVHAFANAVKAANSTDCEMLTDALENVSVVGPQGRVTMDEKTHHASVNTYLSCCNSDGTFSIIESFEPCLPIIPQRYDKISLLPEENSPQIETEQNYDSVYNNILSLVDVAIVLVNTDGMIVHSNRCANKLFGYQEEELCNMSVHELLPPQFRKNHQLYFKKFIDSSENDILMGSRGEISGYKKDGSFFPAKASITKVIHTGKVLLVASLFDNTEQKKHEDYLVWKSTHDTLTQLPNRELMQDRLTNALNRAKRDKHKFALLFADLDNFKLINDSYGHSIGDLLLVEAANRLLNVVRPGDTVARFGGDEFIILCEQTVEESAIASLAQRMNECLNQPFLINNLKLSMSASIGIAFNHDSNITAEDMLRNADVALYQSKDRGRDSWHIYNETIHEQAKTRLSISNKLNYAIERDEFHLCFQSIIDCKSHKIVGVEVLLRWLNDGELISPAVFIPIAEMSGIIFPIGLWIFEQACLTEKLWHEQFSELDMPYVAINVSTRQLSDDRLVEQFTNILHKTGANPKNIVLEITETSMMNDVENTISVLNQFAQLGFGVAVDDFGTGYSSLSQMMHMPISKLKIDRVFIDNIDNNSENETIVRAVIKMAHALNLSVVAEGIERKEEYELLSKINCDMIQGFYFSKPIYQDEAFKFIRSHLN